MWDKTVPVMGLTMRTDSLENLPVYELPERYGWRFYQPGDEREWARLWASAEGFRSEEDALRSFRKDFPTDDHLDRRMIFLTDNGVPFATATAWYGEDGPDGSEGRLHWVCIDSEHQGQGLSKVLASITLKVMKNLGHTHAYLLTQTPCWVAIGVYSKFGFRPSIGDEKAEKGWTIVSEKSGVDYVGLR